MADIVIFVRGGAFQGAISNSSNNRIMIVDYDDEAAVGQVQRSFEAIPVAKGAFVRVINGGEE